MQLVGSISKLSGKDNDFCNDQFCHTSGICKWGVEDCNAVSGSVFEVDLVRANAEAAHYNQILSFTEDSFVQLSFRANSNDMNIAMKIKLVRLL